MLTCFGSSPYSETEFFEPGYKGPQETNPIKHYKVLRHTTTYYNVLRNTTPEHLFCSPCTQCTINSDTIALRNYDRCALALHLQLTYTIHDKYHAWPAEPRKHISGKIHSLKLLTSFSPSSYSEAQFFGPGYKGTPGDHPQQTL